jgi:hypothetical protein
MLMVAMIELAKGVLVTQRALVKCVSVVVYKVHVAKQP